MRSKLSEGSGLGLPSVAAIVGVCDEVELIERCVVHLETIGVGAILVVDNASRDGTEVILDRLQDEGRIEIMRLAPGTPLRLTLADDALAIVRARFGSEWVLFQDADEFLVLRDGNLAKYLGCHPPGAVDVVSFPRGDARVDAGLAAFLGGRGRCEDVTVSGAGERSMAEGMRHPEKVVARSDVLLRWTAGGHRAIGKSGEVLPAHHSVRGVLVNVPFSTPGRLRRKVANIKRLLAENPGHFAVGEATHWRRLAAMDEAAIAAELDRARTPVGAAIRVKRLIVRPLPIRVAGKTRDLIWRIADGGRRGLRRLVP